MKAREGEDCKDRIKERKNWRGEVCCVKKWKGKENGEKMRKR